MRQILLLGMLLGVAVSPALAQPDLLTKAEIYKLVNQAQLMLRNQSPRPAKQADVILPLDAIKTATRSRADLLFNEGSIVRLGGNAVFRFVPGVRNFQLRNGTALFAFLPGDSNSTVVTPEAVVTARGTTIWVQHNSERQTTFVGVLTDSPRTPVTVSRPKGEGAVVLSAGQRIAISKGVIEPVKPMSLQQFYQVCKLAADLGKETSVTQAPPQVQKTLTSVRAETTAALVAQSTRSVEPSTNFDELVPCTPSKEPKEISAEVEDLFQDLPALPNQ